MIRFYCFSGLFKHNLTLRVWRQRRGEKKGKFATYDARDISTDMSFLEMLDVVNEGLAKKGGEPIAFDHDCGEGICGMCGAMIKCLGHTFYRGENFSPGPAPSGQA